MTEFKAIKKIAEERRAQEHNYLKDSGLKRGIILRFVYCPGVEIDRMAR